MTKSRATTVEGYLGELPPERREVVKAVRDTIIRSLPAGYMERINWGMINYEIPLQRYPNTYNGQPLGYVALAAPKNHFALYLMCVYQDPELMTLLEGGFREAGKKFDMGKSCLRFRRLDDLPLDVIAAVVASTPVETFIERYEASRKR